MSDKLLIAKYEDNIIKLSEYQESIHHGKIYCPFCNPPIRVTYNIKGFFMAWRNEGGHNCGKKQVKYFDADWKGRKLTEFSRNKDGELEITIDIYSLISSNINSPLNIKGITSVENSDYKKEFPKYITEEKIEVFRDVIRSVFQMKKMLEKNNFQFLKNLKFRFKTNEGEILSLNDVVIRIDELNKSLIGKSRFVIFKVDSIKVSNKDTIFINSFSVSDVNLTIILRYLSIKNPFRNFKNEYAIAFGKISYSDKYKKYFINLSNDFQIRKLKEEVASELFSEIEFKKYEYTSNIKKVEISNDKQNTFIKDSLKKDLYKNDIETTTINNIKKAYINKVQTDNFKSNSNNSSKVEDEVNYQQKNIFEDKSKNNTGIFCKVKNFFKKIF